MQIYLFSTRQILQSGLKVGGDKSGSIFYVYQLLPTFKAIFRLLLDVVFCFIIIIINIYLLVWMLLKV